MEKTKAYALLGESWAKHLWPYFQTDSFKKLNAKIVNDRKVTQVVPAKEHIFRMFEEVPLEKMRVLIIGQDPYHTVMYDGTPLAIGRAFAVNSVSGYVPPSLKNIVKELSTDVDRRVLTCGFDNSLQHWVDQGVFLLNTALTTCKGVAGAHTKYWEDFTKFTLKIINTHSTNLVVILWGNHAKSFKPLLDNPSFKIIESAHPSPLSCQGFFGSKPFSQANDFLVQHGHWIGWVDGYIHTKHGDTTVTRKFNPLWDLKIKILPYDGQEEV